MANVTEISDATFQSEVLQSDQPVLIDFWAPWCGPCRVVGPIVEELSEEFKDRLKVVKMNIDDNPQTPSQLGIRSIPTLKVFVGGEEKNEMIGAGSKDQLKQLVDASLE